VIIYLDTVDGLGKFIEVESKTGDPLGVTEWARRFSLTNPPVGYVEFMLRQSNFELYRRGRYRLPIDSDRA
jgi:adenylate cyclase class IV